MCEMIPNGRQGDTWWASRGRCWDFDGLDGMAAAGRQDAELCSEGPATHLEAGNAGKPSMPRCWQRNLAK